MDHSRFVLQKFSLNHPQEFPNLPNVVRQATGYRRGHPQTSRNPAEIVIRDVEHCRRRETFQFFGKGPGQTSKSP